MQAKIEQINQAIAEKQLRLKEKAHHHFAAIVLPSPAVMTPPASSSTPPLSYALYAGAAVGTVATLCSSSKLFYGALTLTALAGGYFLTQKQKATHSTASSTAPSLSSLKTKVAAQMIEVVNKTTNEWEEFIALQQCSLHQSIDAAEVSPVRKEVMNEAILTYKVIDISVAAISTMIDTVQNITELKQQIQAYEAMLLVAIDKTSQKQINIYKSLLD